MSSEKLPTKTSTEFNWISSESAPEDYPMEIISGTFVFKGEKTRGLYIPNGGTLNHNWGTSISAHAVGPDFKPLPDRLDITFFSYAEKQFYQGSFELPYEKMLKHFREDRGPISNIRTYAKIIAGIAPGGIVSVWIGGQRQVEVFYGKAEKVELNLSVAFQLPFEDDQQAEKYMHDGLIEAISAEQYQSLLKDGIPFDLWDRYRKHYHWLPVISNTEQTLEQTQINFLNGEYDREVPLGKFKQEGTAMPLPRYIGFEGKYIYQVDFNEDEIMQSFEQLSPNGEFVRMEFDLKYPRSLSRITLRTEQSSIQLSKAVFKDW